MRRPPPSNVTQSDIAHASWARSTRYLSDPNSDYKHVWHLVFGREQWPEHNRRTLCGQWKHTDRLESGVIQPTTSLCARCYGIKVGTLTLSGRPA